MNVPNRQFILAARPSGVAKLSDFKLVQTERPSPEEGQLLLRNTLISVDPYQRNLMGNGSSELPSIDVGAPMPGPTVAVVEASRHPDFGQGEQVQTWSGWQEYAISGGSDLRKLDTGMAPLSTALGVLGHTGLTAWVGMSKLGDVKPGGTLVVTAAAGSVGSLAAQIGKQHGLRVVGIAGGPEKIAYLTDELGLDEALDYKADDFGRQLEHVLRDGIDALYDNVGDWLFEALMPHLNKHARIVICGTIAGYSDTELPVRPDHLPWLLNLFLYRFIEIRGFSVTDHLDRYPDFLGDMSRWVAESKIKYSEEFVDGFEKIPETFLRLFEGRNRGKLIVRAGA